MYLMLVGYVFTWCLLEVDTSSILLTAQVQHSSHCTSTYVHIPNMLHVCMKRKWSLILYVPFCQQDCMVN